MCNISNRLLEERKRLKKNQAEMAGIGGVAKRTYCNYESGKREPMASFFSSIAAAGADVQYILTGVYSIKEESKCSTVDHLTPISTDSSRRQGDLKLQKTDKNLMYPAREDTREHRKHVAEGLADYQPLRPDELALLDNLAHCPEEVQDAIRKLALVSARSDKDKKESGTS